MEIHRIANYTSLKFKRKMANVLQYAHHHQLSPDVVQRMMDYYIYKHHGEIFNEKEILENISPKFRQVGLET